MKRTSLAFSVGDQAWGPDTICHMPIVVNWPADRDLQGEGVSKPYTDAKHDCNVPKAFVDGSGGPELGGMAAATHDLQQLSNLNLDIAARSTPFQEHHILVPV